MHVTFYWMVIIEQPDMSFGKHWITFWINMIQGKNILVDNIGWELDEKRTLKVMGSFGDPKMNGKNNWWVSA